MKIGEAIDHAIEHAFSTRAEGTGKAYQNALRRFCDFLEETEVDLSGPLSEITMHTFIRYQFWLVKNYKKKTAEVYSAASKFLLDWMVIEGYLDPTYNETLRYEMAVKQIRRKREDYLPRFPEEDDVEKMQKAAREINGYDSPIPERNIALVEFLASTGCRVGEAVKLKIKDLDGSLKSAIVLGKGSKERRVFLNKRARKALSNYWEARGFSSRNHPVFARHDKGVGRGKNFKIKHITVRTADNIIEEIADLAGIEQFTPHYFRHAFAIKALHDSGNLALVQDLMGHASPTATRVYAKIRPKDLEDAHREIFND